MWTSCEIAFEIEDAEGDIAIVRISTPIGTIVLLGKISIHKDILSISDAHIQGLTAGDLGRSGLNVIGRRLLEEACVKSIVIQGGTRTTGRNKGRKPKLIRFPNTDSSEFEG